MHDLVVLGDLVADLIVPVEQLPILPNRHGWAEGIFLEPGGAGNILVAATRMGLSTAALSPLGKDQYGADVLAMLVAEGVDVGHAAMWEGRDTIICIVLADKLGQHVYLAIKDNVGLWPFPPAWLEIIRAARAIFTDGYTLVDILAPEDLLSAYRLARQSQTLLVFDPGPSIAGIPRELCEQVFGLTDVLLLTEEEACELYGDADREGMARRLLTHGPQAVVLKLGDEGCLAVSADETVHHPGFRVEVADTVGCGDSFDAAFIAGWLRGGSLRECAALANAMGALVATQRGAGTRIPAPDRLLEVLAGDQAARLVRPTVVPEAQGR